MDGDGVAAESAPRGERGSVPLSCAAQALVLILPYGTQLQVTDMIYPRPPKLYRPRFPPLKYQQSRGCNGPPGDF